MPVSNASILALDVGDRRVGVAIASEIARLARPYCTLDRHNDILVELERIIGQENIRMIVVGYPRNLQGHSTAQTAATEEFVTLLNARTDVPTVYQDEAVTSRQAEHELAARGKPYQKSDIDALAATYILEDFLRTHAGDVYV